MKRSAAAHLLPLQAEDLLVQLGGRISLARRARGITQPDLAAKAGMGVSTLTQIEKGVPTVQIGFYLAALWALDLLDSLMPAVTALGRDAGTSALLEEPVPMRVRGRSSRSPAR